METETYAKTGHSTFALAKANTWRRRISCWGENSISVPKAVRKDPIRNLDLLRSCAVLLVVLSHLFVNCLKLPDRGMGRLGVMMFFVHTSLVLMMSLERSEVGTLNLVRSFYLRRAFRIYPLSILAVCAVTLLHIPSDPFQRFQQPSHFELLSNLTLTQNITRAGSVIGPLWSLPWEVQMYVALPLLFLIVRNRKFAILGALSATIIATNVIGLRTGHTVVRIFDYFPCFLSGVVAYVLMRSRKCPRIPGRCWPLGLAILMGVYIWSGVGQRHGGLLLYREWAACLVLGLLIPLFSDIGAGFTSNAARFIARYSYGIYLFHVPALWLAFDHLGWLGRPLSALVFVGTTATMSVAGYHIIENPMIGCGRWLVRGHKMPADFVPQREVST